MARSIGVDVVRYQPSTHYLARRMQLLRSHDIDLILDIGANDGQYAIEVRRLGYRGRIVSFEPLPDVATRLRERTADDPAWTMRAVALGDAPGSATINIAGNSASSSLLSMLPEHEHLAPGTACVGHVKVDVERFDDIADEVIEGAANPYMKIDTQGFEARVLEGAKGSLDRIAGMQLELSIVPLYGSAPLYIEILHRLDAAGFVLMGIEPGFSDPSSGQLLQFDGIFYRPESIAVEE